MKKFLKHGRRMTAFLLTVILTATFLPMKYLGELFSERLPGTVEAETTLSNPRIVEDSSMEAGQRVTWDCIWFGDYPQTEVDPDSEIYNFLNNLSEGSWDLNNDTVYEGIKYRRLRGADATSAPDDSNNYNWNNDYSSYHYFRYDPIKWRVLNINNNKAFLLSDLALDDQVYNSKNVNVTWESSSIRSWLNGYGTGSNSCDIDFAKKNFLDCAFSDIEQTYIYTSTVINDDNLKFGTDGGNDTKDQVFLLSESEVWSKDRANKYGFKDDTNINDEAKFCKCSDYAHAMGVATVTKSAEEFQENCVWRLRSPGLHSNFVTYVSYRGCGYINGEYVTNVDDGIRPALNLNLSSNDVWNYAGTVCSDNNSLTIDSEHCGIVFSDYNTGEEIKGVTFTYNGVKYTSKNDGSALIEVSNFTNKLNTTFSATGYMDYKVEDVNLIRGGVLNITLVPVADKPTVYRCEMQYDGSSSTIDVLKKSKTLAQGSKKQFSLTAVAGYKDEIAKYQLISDGKIIKESTSGVFSGLTAASFKEGASICIRAAGKKGRGYAYGSTQQLYLKVKNNILADSNTQETVSVGEKITIQLDSSIPLLGGNEISFDLGELPVYFETDGSKIRAGINFVQASASNDGKKWEGSAFSGFSDENWAKIKESVKKNFSPKEFMKKNKEAKDIFKTQGVLFADVGTVSAEADVWGYLEADMDNSYVSGEISITASVSASTENQFAVGAIPMVLTVKLSGGLDDGTVNLTASTGITSLKDLKLTATVKPQIGLDVGVGPGMAKLGSLTVNGKGNLSYTYTRTTALASHKVDLTAGMYLKFKALSFEYKKNIAENTWILYNDSKTVRSAGTAAVDLMDTGQYELADRSYLQTQSEWNPASKARTFAADAGSTTSLIQSSVYDDPQLQVVQAGDVTMMIFLTDDSSRTDINRTKLVYSIYDKEIEKWGEPQAVEDDDTADFMPAAAKYGNDIYIAWVNMNAAMNDDASQEAFAAAGEISLAKYNGTGFEVTRLTNNDYYDTMPAISADETGVTVSWTGSLSNNILGNDDQNRLYVYRSADAQTNCLAEGLKSVKDVVTGKIGTTEAAAFVSDADGDYSTTDDQTLKILGTDGNILFTRTDAGEMTRLMIKDGSLIWYEDGTLCSLNYVNGEAGRYHGFTGQINSAYEMLETDAYEYLVCLDSVRDETNDFTDVEMYAYVYDKAEQSWGERVNVTNIGSAVQDYAVFLTEDGSLAGVLGINAFSYENEEYSNTMSLYALKAAPAADYELSEVYYSDVVESEDGYGYQLDAVADIKNIGIAKGNDYTVDLKKGDTVIDSVSLPALPAGKECSEELTFHLQNLPEENSDYMVVLNSENENNLENNSKTINLGHANLSISCDDTIQDDIHTVCVTVKNDSLYDVNNASVALYFNEDGENIETKEIGMLSGSDQTTFTTEINANEVLFDGDSKLVFAKVTSDSSELTEEDNTDYFTIDKPVGSVALPDDNTVVDEGGTDINTKPGDTGSTDNTDTGKNPAVSSKSKLLRITLSGISKKIAAGKKIKLTAQGIPVGAPLSNLTWTSSNPKVATVTQTGVVTVKKKTGGKTVTIIATAADGGGVSASWKIKSMKGVVKKINVSGAKTVKAGKSLKLKAKVTATKGANKKLKWTSSNTKYATVTSSGKVKTFKAGKGKKVKITAMATDGSNKKKTVTIKIK